MWSRWAVAATVALTQIALQKQPNFPQLRRASIPEPKHRDPQSQPREGSSPAHSVPQPCTGSGPTITGKRCDLGLQLRGAADAYTGGAPDLYEHTSPSFFSTPLLQGKAPVWGERKHTHLKGTEPAQAGPSGLLLQQLGSRPHPRQSDGGH